MIYCLQPGLHGEKFELEEAHDILAAGVDCIQLDDPMLDPVGQGFDVLVEPAWPAAGVRRRIILDRLAPDRRSIDENDAEL